MLKGNQLNGFWGRRGTSSVNLPLGAEVTLTGNPYTAQDFNPGQTLSWSRVVYDRGGWWIAGAPTLLTVPPGVSWVRVYGQARVSGGTLDDYTQILIAKNGSVLVPTILAGDTTNSTTPRIQILSYAIPVVPGDGFDFRFFINTDASTTLVDSDTFFSIEALHNGV